MQFLGSKSQLDRLGVKHNTNKSTDWTRPSDGQRIQQADSLLSHYEFFLGHLRDKRNLKVLELGAGPDDNIGASVRVWKEYFPDDAEVHVADIKQSSKALEKEGFYVHVGDLGSQDFLDALRGRQWDFVIDDASHIWVHQILAFRTLFPRIASGGIFIMEDLCTSFAGMRQSYSLGLDMKDAVQFFLALSRGTCAPFAASKDEQLSEIYTLSGSDIKLLESIRMVTWMRNACIVIKR